MPAAFEKCVREGGRVRTKKLKGNKYIHICFKDGKSYAGEVKTAKSKHHSAADGKFLDDRMRKFGVSR